ncbi:MAG: ABC transporter permease [Acidimicrobiaceae bacterium]|nr:ABC transporter permease [Acidimicrobiaceae bacterium]MYA74031.1 ABC transporter permease [Acidimicrobiaceae bacterium]MYC42324.1 ABC transporter permease [Acidimicrobiaceae bacterium]MYG55371.1 ABC transporter permease [Acidimicrobiaceae bacterium]MYJ99552.1 ABC transporter permease [Acidimicrobiaceae bacterium]
MGSKRPVQFSLTPTLSPSVRKSITLIYHFAERESKSRYKRSLLGWFWSFLNPLVTVGVYWFIFGAVYRAVPPVTNNGNAENFGLYLFTGLIIWTLFTGLVEGSMDWLSSVSDLRKKIYFPTETALLGGAASNLVQTLLEVAVLVVIMTALSNISWTLVFLPVAMALALGFGLGLGFIVSVLNARYRDVKYLSGILLNVAFFAVPIVYTPELLKKEQIPEIARLFVEWNPVALFIEISRDAAYFLQVPLWNRFLAAVVWSVTTFVIGWVFFRRQSMSISEEP